MSSPTERPPAEIRRRSRWLWLFLWLPVLVLAAIGVASLVDRDLLESRDRPTFVFLLEYDPPHLLPREPRPDAPHEFEAFRETQASLVSHPIIIERAIVSLGTSTSFRGGEGSPDVALIGKHLRTSFPGRQLLEVTLHLPGRSRDESYRVLEAVCREYLDEYQGGEQKVLRYRLERLQGIAHRNSDRDRRERSTLRGLRESLPQPGEVDRLGLALDLVLTDLQRARVDLARKQAEFKVRTPSPKDETTFDPDAFADEKDPVLASLISRHAALVTPSSDSSLTVEDRIRRQAERMEVLESIRQRQMALRSLVRAQLQREIDVGQESIVRLTMELERLRSDMQNAAVNSSSLEVYAQQRRVDLEDENLRLVMREVDRLQMEEEMMRPPGEDPPQVSWSRVRLLGGR